MRRRYSILPFITLAAVLAGCTETPTAPEARSGADRGPVTSMARGGFQAPAKHLVVFKGRAPANFDAHGIQRHSLGDTTR